MTTNSVKYPNLLDLANRTDPDGSIAAVVEILNQENEILDDMMWVEGNQSTGHTSTIRSGIPTPTWTKLYDRVQPAKSRTVQITDNCGMMQQWGEVDKNYANINGNTAEFRLSEERPAMEGMAQEMAQTLFYGNEGTEPEAFTGLSPRFNSLSAENGDNIIDAQGSGSDNGSIWLVVWGDTTCHGIIPKGSKAGLQVDDLGEMVSETSDGLLRVYRTHYQWHAGLVVRDWRYIVRIANIDKSDLSTTFASGAFSSGANLPNLMFKALRLIPNLSRGKPAFYMSRDMATFVAQQTLAMGQNGLITSDKVSGDEKFAEAFHGIPMRRVDVLAANEAEVT